MLRRITSSQIYSLVSAKVLVLMIPLLTITNFVRWALILGLLLDRVILKAVMFKLRQLSVDGLFLRILIEFLSNRLQRVVVDGQSNEYRNVILVYCREVYLALSFTYCILMIWSLGPENVLVSYANDTTLLACIPSPNMRSNNC